MSVKARFMSFSVGYAMSHAANHDARALSMRSRPCRRVRLVLLDAALETRDDAQGDTLLACLCDVTNPPCTDAGLPEGKLEQRWTVKPDAENLSSHPFDFVLDAAAAWPWRHDEQSDHAHNGHCDQHSYENGVRHSSVPVSIVRIRRRQLKAPSGQVSS